MLLCHTLIDILTFTILLSEPCWTGIVSLALRFTRVASLSVDTHVVIWTRGCILQTFIDINTVYQVEFEPWWTFVFST